MKLDRLKCAKLHFQDSFRTLQELSKIFSLELGILMIIKPLSLGTGLSLASDRANLCLTTASFDWTVS